MGCFVMGHLVMGCFVIGLLSGWDSLLPNAFWWGKNVTECCEMGSFELGCLVGECFLTGRFMMGYFEMERFVMGCFVTGCYITGLFAIGPFVMERFTMNRFVMGCFDMERFEMGFHDVSIRTIWMPKGTWDDSYMSPPFGKWPRMINITCEKYARGGVGRKHTEHECQSNIPNIGANHHMK